MQILKLRHDADCVSDKRVFVDAHGRAMLNLAACTMADMNFLKCGVTYACTVMEHRPSNSMSSQLVESYAASLPFHTHSTRSVMT